MGAGLLLVALVGLPGNAPADDKGLSIGYFVDRENEADPDTIRDRLEQWLRKVSGSNSLDEVSATVESNHRKWSSAVQSGEYDLHGLYSYQYLELEDDRIMRPALATTDTHGITSTFLLITRRQDQLTSIDSLRDKKILVDTGGFGELPMIWLATKLASATEPENVPDFADVVAVQNPIRALLPVYFGKADACVITRSAFKDANSLNSELITKLHSITNSKPLLVSLVAFRKDFPNVEAAKIVSLAVKGSTQTEFANLFEQLGRKGLVKIDDSALLTVRALHQNYRQIFASEKSERTVKEAPER